MLQKSLYGLKQYLRQWYKRFDEFMLRKGYMKCNFDHCVYHKQLRANQYIYLLIYVDDMLIACKDKAEIENLKTILKFEFEMKNLGAAKRILGIDIKRDRRKGALNLSQTGYLKKIVELFGMNNCKPVFTPILAHFKLYAVKGDLSKDEESHMKKVPYSNAVGSLMYAMIGTKPDIAYGVSLVSRFVSKPSRDH